MKKIILILATTSVVMISLISCKLDFTHKTYPFFIDNKSDFVISSYLALGRGGVSYPDTTLSFNRENVGYETKPHTQLDRGIPTFSYKEWLDKLPQDTLSVYIFSKDTLDTYSWEVIKQKYNVLQRYDLCLKDFNILLNKNGYPMIVYPPSETMKGMKMYPPYNKQGAPVPSDKSNK